MFNADGTPVTAGAAHRLPNRPPAATGAGRPRRSSTPGACATASCRRCSPLAVAAARRCRRSRACGCGAAAAGIRYQGRTDLVLAEFAPGTTRRRRVHPQHMPRRAGRLVPRRAARRHGRAALVVNAGNANVFTGARRARGGRRRPPRRPPRCSAAPPSEVFLASHRRDRRGAAARAHHRRAARAARTRCADDAWEAAARGIMTTDTFPKARHPRRAASAAPTVRITGIAKGSGMIAPDMATMLCFVFTDATIPGRRAAGDAARRRRPQLQLHHGRQRHLDQRHGAAVRHRRRRSTRGSPTDRATLRGFRRGAGRGAARSGAAGGARRRGRAEAGPHRRDRRGRSTRSAQRDRRWRSPTRRW